MNIKSSLTPTKKYKSLIWAMHSLYRLVNSTYELKDLLTRLARLLCQIFDARFCRVMLADAAGAYSIFKCQVSDNKKCLIEKRVKVSGRIERRILRKFSSIREEYLLGIPLISEEMTGLIVLERDVRVKPFDDFDYEMFMALGEQIAIAIKSLQLYEEQQKTVLGSIKSLASLLDMRIPSGYAHSRYFSKLVVGIASEMHLDSKQTESIKYASLLHDAGRVDIPFEILAKPAKLTRKEFTIIKRHPAKGALILRTFPILRPVVPIIMHHHEKYDGTGYPSRLKKGQIPIGARIMAVADAFEAMVYGRPYRERMDFNAAIKEIRKKSGTQFDPRVVEAFLKAIRKTNPKKYLQPPKRRRYNES